MKRVKNKYKFYSGVQQITPDITGYDKTWEMKNEMNAKREAGKNVAKTGFDIAGMAVGIPGLGGIAQGVDQLSSAAFKDAKGNYKNKASELLANKLNPLEKTGKAFSALTGDKAAAADLFSGSLMGTGLMKLGMKNPFGKTSQEKIKDQAKEEEHKTAMENANKGFATSATTDAQSALAKKGKYKLKSKQPRMIETEGREPIFSPEKADGTRDLLYYNPSDPTHEEGGVKAVVMPKAQKGKQKVKSQPEDNTDKESWFENFAEIVEPTGLTSWGDAYRSLKNAKNNPNKENITDAAFETLGVIPFLGKAKYFGKLGRSLRAGKFASKGKNLVTDVLGGTLSDEGFNYQKGTYKGRSIFPKFTETFKNLTSYEQGTSNLMPKRPASKYSLVGNGNMAVGSKQLKVNTLNDTALSSNLGGMPAVNAANKFVQPMAGINQVARNIPEVRRKEKKNTPRSHKTANPDTNRIIDPPMLYEMKPPAPRSTFNTKNDYNKGSKKVKVYR